MSLTRKNKKEKVREPRTKITWKEVKRQKVLLFWAAIMVAYGVIFYYLPLAGWAMAFQDYKPRLGIFHSAFVGLDKFKMLFSDMTFIRVIRNTLAMGVINLVVTFVTTAMITRYCIDGGLEPEQAYRLSDFYILKMDSCSTVRQVADLHHEMAKDFTGKMVLQKKSSILSKPVTQCVDYIYSNIKERITIADLAAYTGLSESYLSRVFKQNLGVSISDYIREKKIEKATHLLKYSDKPIIDIANYLSFSSQSHFIQIFESFTGLTPKKYRDRYYKSMW